MFSRNSLYFPSFFRYDQFKKQVCVLLQTLGTESLGGASSAPAVRNSSHSILKFRKAVIAVMAARRIKMLPHNTKSVFTFTDFQNTQGVVCLGSLKSAKRRRGKPRCVTVIITLYVGKRGLKVGFTASNISRVRVHS